MARTTPAAINPEALHAYLDDALSEEETAQVEKALRESEKLRRQLSALMQTRDRGEHTIGAIWRRQRLSCPSREELGSYLLQVLDRELQKYVDFHLQTVGCPFCQANLTDLQTLQQEPAPKSQERRKRFFESSAGYLQVCRETKRRS
jgi:Putative zinc-finger